MACVGAGTNEGRHKPAFSIRTLTCLTALVGQNIRQFAAGGYTEKASDAETRRVAVTLTPEFDLLRRGLHAKLLHTSAEHALS